MKSRPRTKLVLARKSKGYRWRASVANWLYTVARRMARNVRVTAQRRSRREAHAAIPEAIQPVDQLTGRELLLALFGVLRSCSGEVLIDGAPVRINSPTTAKSGKIGMALIPEDRKTEGLMLPMTVRDNLSFASLHRISNNGIVNRAIEQKLIDDMINLLGIRTAGTDIAVGSLSGGNQQKVVIAKWLMNQPRIILLNDPTRGIDVGTKQELYVLLRKLADEGAAIIFYSTDYDELIGCCDRVLVLYDGKVKRELVGAGITERALVASALNIEMGEAGHP